MQLESDQLLAGVGTTGPGERAKLTLFCGGTSCVDYSVHDAMLLFSSLLHAPLFQTRSLLGGAIGGLEFRCRFDGLSRTPSWAAENPCRSTFVRPAPPTDRRRAVFSTMPCSTHHLLAQVERGLFDLKSNSNIGTASSAREAPPVTCGASGSVCVGCRGAAQLSIYVRCWT